VSGRSEASCNENERQVMKKGWNIKPEFRIEMADFIKKMPESTEIERRNKKILRYVVVNDYSALTISKINDPLIISYGNRSRGKQLTSMHISRIINSYFPNIPKRIDYSQRNYYERRKELINRKNKGMYNDYKKCGKCGSTENLELHHMIPMSLGGTNDENNLIWLCNKCHKKVTQYQMNIS
jgi:hypothetical protein